MLEQLTEPDEPDAQVAPYAPAVGAAFMGAARDIRRRVAAEDREYDRLVEQLIEPVRDRLRRFPRRRLRPEMLAGLIQDWRFMPQRDWRLSCIAKLDKARASLIEHRLVAGLLRRPADPNLVSFEEDLAVTRIELTVDRARAHLESRCIATFSLHAIGRRLQRHPDDSVEALLFDMNTAADASCGDLVAGAGYRIKTQPDGGGWRGRVIRQTGPGGDQRNVLAIRTWLDS